ncbi:MAG: hypothetical protein AAF563_07830 [Pseudomonadota bacterium]
MTFSHRWIGLFGAVLLLAGCETADSVLFPTLTGEDPAGETEAQQGELADGESVVLYSDETITVEPMGSVTETQIDETAFGNTGTFVGQKVRELAGELEQLKSSVRQNRNSYENQRVIAEQNAQRYYATVAAITARLQIGTTPGNPVLVSQYNAAQAQLDQVANDVAIFNTLNSAVASNAALTSYISDAIDATFRLSGAVEEDHRQLGVLEDENNRTIVTVERTLNDLNSLVERQTVYVNAERRRLTQLAQAINSGRLYGPALDQLGTLQAPAALTSEVALATREPLVVIRFAEDDVAYQDALYQAVSAALERKPGALFDLVAVAPAAGSAGEVALNSSAVKRNAEDVLRTLSEMGLPADRLTLSAVTAGDADVNQVRIYVR